jgi:hypothetical protein
MENAVLAMVEEGKSLAEKVIATNRRVIETKAKLREEEVELSRLVNELKPVYQYLQAKNQVIRDDKGNTHQVLSPEIREVISELWHVNDRIVRFL